MAEPKPTFINAPAEYEFHRDAAKLLPWSWALERLETARNYWLATVGPDHGPHLTPVWAVWMENRLYFEGRLNSRWARNLAQNPRAVVHLESAKEVVVVEGTVVAGMVDAELAQQIDATWEAKYAKFMPNGAVQPIHTLTPRVARGWTTEWMSRGTRWEFDT